MAGILDWVFGNYQHDETFISHTKICGNALQIATSLVSACNSKQAGKELENTVFWTQLLFKSLFDNINVLCLKLPDFLLRYK